MAIVLLIGFGLILGSFANAVIWRLHEQDSATRPLSKKRQRELSILRGRSMCVHCHHQLAPADLVPVVSYLWLKGKCRYCRKPIDDTPIAELLMPILFVASYLCWPYSLSATGFTPGWALFLGWLACSVAFVILALYDLKWFLLPDRVVFPLIAVTAAMVLLRAATLGGGWESLIGAGWGVLLTAGLFYLIYLVSKGAWIGFGDVKLAVALGMLAGGALPALLLLFLASFTGSLSTLPLMLRGKLKSKTRIPFGPFLLLGTVLVVLFGGKLIAWYAALFIARM